MNKVIFFAVCLMACVSGYCQKVTVSGQSEKIKGDAVDGYGTELEGKKEDVSSAWIKFLKEIGKVKQSNNPMTLTEAVFNGLLFSKGIIYIVANDKGEKTSIWLGIKPSEWEADNVARINNELEKAVYRFGVKYYRDKIQVDIDQAQQAADAVVKQQQRITNQSKDLTLQLGNNEQEKIQLDKSIENNKFENAVLKVKLENNKKAQDSLAAATVQIQKMKQVHVERQRKVN